MLLAKVWTVQTLKSFGRILNLQKSTLEVTHCLECMGLVLPQEKLLTLHSQTWILVSRDHFKQIYKRLLGLMVAFSKAVLFSQLHFRPLQLSVNNKTLQSLDKLIYLTLNTRFPLAWRLKNPFFKLGKFFLPLSWKIITMNANLKG